MSSPYCRRNYWVFLVSSGLAAFEDLDLASVFGVLYVTSNLTNIKPFGFATNRFAGFSSSAPIWRD